MRTKDVREAEQWGERFDLTQIPDLADPYALFAEIQEATPAFYSPMLDFWVVTRYRDVRHVLETPELYSAANSGTLLQSVAPEARLILAKAGYRPVQWLLNADPPEHTGWRQLAQADFMPPRIAELKSFIRGLTVRLTRRFLSRGRADLMRELAWDVPGLVMFHILGIPESDVAQVRTLVESRMRLMWGQASAAEQIDLAHRAAAFWQYCEALAAERARQSGDDLLGYLTGAHTGHAPALTHPEMTTLIYGLLSGTSTTAAFIGNAFLRLLGEPGAWKAISGDAGIIPNAVEELLRLDAPSIVMCRKTRDIAVNLSGVSIPPGASLLLLLGAANHDPAVFEDPDRLDIYRANAKNHFSFGYGTHYCLGAPLGRLEARVVLEEVSARLPQLRLAPGQDLRYLPSWQFRGLLSLPVEWDAPEQVE